MTLEGNAWIHPEELPDAFPAAPRLDAYVPRRSTEETLTYLEAKVTGGPGWYELSGPPGVGKTLLLRLLGRRLAFRATPVYLPYPMLDARDVARWVLRALEAPVGASARASLVAQADALAEADHPLVLLIDDAQLLPEDTAGWLAGLTGDEARLRLVAAVNEGGPRSPSRADARAFAEPLGLEEVVPYVEAHLARVGASDPLRALFGGERMQALALESEGNPRRIQRLADARIVRALQWADGRARQARPPAPALQRSSPSAPRRRPEPTAATQAHGASARRAPWSRLPPLQAAALVAGALALAALLTLAPPVDLPRAAAPSPSPAPPAKPPWRKGVVLRITCDEPAQLALDGDPLGPPPIAVVSVPPGEHTLAVRFGDGARVETKLNVRPESPWVKIAGRKVQLGPASLTTP